MASESQKGRIFGALVIAGVLIGGSIFLSYGNLNFLNPSIANAASTQALLQELATRDSSNEGMPDWEVELYGLDPSNPHSFSPTITNVQAIEEGLVKPKFLTPSANSDEASSSDASSTDDDADQLEGVTAAPGSLTDQFAQIMLQQYLTQSATAVSNGEEPSDVDIDSAAQSALQQFAIQNQHTNAYSISQVQKGGSGPDALKSYAAAMETAFAKYNPHTTENELDYFSDAVEKNDATALQNVSKIGLSYSSLAPALMEVPVPLEMQNAHLETVNAMARLGDDITDMSMINSDPLRAYFGLAQYETDSEAMVKGMADMGNVFSQEQVTIPEGQPGYFIVNATNNAESTESQITSQNQTQ
jgi:uncharacterized membrane protein YkoI